MAGNTGKMTAEALRARGPRLFLVRAFNPFTAKQHGLAIVREGSTVFNKRVRSSTTLHLGIVARSYSLKYLQQVAGGNR